MHASPNLRAWLARQPHPTTIRAEKLDGDEKTVRIGVARSKFRDAEAALKDCVRCEALDESGATLRVWEAENAEELSRKVLSGAPDPDGPRAMLIEFARLLATGADQAAARHEALVKVAFEQHAALVAVLSNRLAALEKAWHQLLMSQQPEQNPGDALMGALAPLIMGGMQAPPPQPNGANSAG